MMFFGVLYSKEKYRCRVKMHANKVLSINFYQSNISHSDNIDFAESIFYTFFTLFVLQMECKIKMECHLECNVGHCDVSAEGQRCICPPLYGGERCEHYMCSQHCKNNGWCFADLLFKGPDIAHPPLKVCTLLVSFQIPI